MSQIHEHGGSTDDIEFTFDRETLGEILLRHPWAVRFVAFEAFVVGLAGVIPLLGSSAFHYVAFGMILSLGVLVAAAAVMIGLVLAAKRIRYEIEYGDLQSRLDVA